MALASLVGSCWTSGELLQGERRLVFRRVLLPRSLVSPSFTFLGGGWEVLSSINFFQRIQAAAKHFLAAVLPFASACGQSSQLRLQLSHLSLLVQLP